MTRKLKFSLGLPCSMQSYPFLSLLPRASQNPVGSAPSSHSRMVTLLLLWMPVSRGQLHTNRGSYTAKLNFHFSFQKEDKMSTHCSLSLLAAVRATSRVWGWDLHPCHRYMRAWLPLSSTMDTLERRLLQCQATSSRWPSTSFSPRTQYRRQSSERNKRFRHSDYFMGTIHSL